MSSWAHVILIAAVLAGCSTGNVPRIVPAATIDIPTSASAQQNTPPAIAAADDRIAVLTGELAKATAERAAAERQAKEAELAAWRKWSRWIAGLALPLCAAAAGLGMWFGMARIALPISGAGAIACITLVVFAEALGFIAWLVPGIGLLSIVSVAVVMIRRRDHALAATAKLADAIEARAYSYADKLDARHAQVRAGVHGVIQAARGKK